MLFSLLLFANVWARENIVTIIAGLLATSATTGFAHLGSQLYFRSILASLHMWRDPRIRAVLRMLDKLLAVLDILIVFGILIAHIGLYVSPTPATQLGARNEIHLPAFSLLELISCGLW